MKLIPVLLLLATLNAHAGPGHDEAPAASAGPAAPRFSATSDAFELVGQLQGQTLTLWLDRAATNEPVPQARIALTLGAAKLEPRAQADGSFKVELASAPPEGLLPVTATVTVGSESDLLAGELDLHASTDADGHDDHAPRWPWLLGAAVLVSGVAAFVLRARRARTGASA